jgi:hypothetical protein
MYNLMIFIVLIFFIIYNFYKYNKEYFSNAYQDTELRAKLSHHGTNLSLGKPLLTLYFDRREPNCKYFYDYFSTTFGGLDNSLSVEERNLRFQDETTAKFTGKSQAWNQLKKIYADNSTFSASPNPDKNYDIINNVFLTIEEIEVKDGHLYDFNNKPALKIEDGGAPENIGYIEYDGETPREYKQYLRPKDFLKRIPWVTLSFFKHKSEKEIDDLLESLNTNLESENKMEYDDLKEFQKYEYYVIEYDGIYSPNNRQIKATLDNIIKFINDTYEKYLEFDDKADFESYTGQLWNFNFLKLGYTKCEECSEYYKNN